MSAPERVGPAPDERAVAITILNRQNGQVLEVTLERAVEPQSWAALERRLLRIVQLRQPAELRLDLDGVGGLTRYPAGLAMVAAALAEVGGRLTTATTA